ncbi:MAG: manganese efflux pump MntP family protein [Bacteroidales bacterium]|nr:manganese efflux pump MntP family protein [Bacteroidales bacterium]
MNLSEIILIAIGLSMDAFAVSITLGLAVKKLSTKDVLIPGVYFGFFQALMPLVGYYAGTLFAHNAQNLGPWVAFVLLGFVGGKVIKDSFSKNDDKVNETPFVFLKMLLLAIATSIDALAVGVTFAFFEIDIFVAILIIGLITFGVFIGGVKIGNLFGAKYRSRAEFAGGAVLVLLGVKMLIF